MVVYSMPEVVEEGGKQDFMIHKEGCNKEAVTIS